MVAPQQFVLGTENSRFKQDCERRPLTKSGNKSIIRSLFLHISFQNVAFFVTLVLLWPFHITEQETSENE